MRTRGVRWLIVASLTAIVGGCKESTSPHSGPKPPGNVPTTTLGGAGASAVFLTAADFATNLTLQPGSAYLIAVVNTDPSHTTSEGFTLAGTNFAASGDQLAETSAPGVSGQRVPVAATSHSSAARYEISSAAARRLASFRKMQKNHLRMLQRDVEVFQNSRALRRKRSGAAPAASAVAPYPVAKGGGGSVQRIYIAKEFGATCTDVDSIGARNVAEGQHVIVLADTNQTTWPNGLRPDSSFYQTFADEFDAVTWPHITTYIGDPLALDADLSGLGKITVVISPVLNGFSGGIVAFVDGCDFNTPTPGQSLDNDTEMFYYFTPDTALGWTVQPWENLLRSTAAHETKHIVSYTDRIINNDFTVPELIWLEEGLAQESSEIWERHFNFTSWKGQAGFEETVGCEIYLGPSGPPCDASGNKPITLLGGHLPFLFDYLAEESPNPAGAGLGSDTPSNYGAGWQFARWATDQYATTEPELIKSLINEPALSGLPNLAAQTGRSIPELLVYWSLASAIYDTATYVALDKRLTNPSFDFRQIFYVGQTALTCGGTRCGLFGKNGSTTPVFPVQPVQEFANSVPINATAPAVPGTTAYYLILYAQNAGTEYLRLENASGGAIAAASGFRVGIVRVR